MDVQQFEDYYNELWFKDRSGLTDLIGKDITQIYWTDRYLGFVTSHSERFVYEVSSDCCSKSYLHDFYGVQKLIRNGPVTSVNYIPIAENSGSHIQTILEPENFNDQLNCYGYRIFTESPQWGEQTSVFSFRNENNGGYSGHIELINAEFGPHDTVWTPGNEITEDKV